MTVCTTVHVQISLILQSDGLVKRDEHMSDELTKKILKKHPVLVPAPTVIVVSLYHRQWENCQSQDFGLQLSNSVMTWLKILKINK